MRPGDDRTGHDRVREDVREPAGATMARPGAGSVADHTTPRRLTSVNLEQHSMSICVVDRKTSDRTVPIKTKPKP